jgi:hypothetical protein
MISKASERLDGTHCRWRVQYGAKSFLRWLEQRMIAAAPIVLEATAEVSDDACELADGDVEDSPPDAPA